MKVVPISDRILIRVFVLIGAFASLLAIFVLKTVYYYSYNRVRWWLYLALLGALFLGFVWYISRPKSHKGLVLVGVSFLLSWLPFELEFPRLIGLLSDQRELFLSGLASKLPGIASAVLFDVLFYPLLIAIPLLIAARTTTPIARP